MYGTKIAMVRMKEGDLQKGVTDAFEKIFKSVPPGSEIVNHSFTNIASASELPNLMIVALYKTPGGTE